MMVKCLSKTNMQESSCKPCSEAILPVTGDDLQALTSRISSKWRVIDEHHIENDYTFKDFRTALDFANRVGGIAEELNHHPDLHVSWGKVRVTSWTHKVNGLTESDFVLANRIDKLSS